MIFVSCHGSLPFSLLSVLTVFTRFFDISCCHQCTRVITPCIPFIRNHISQILIIELIFESLHGCTWFTIQNTVDMSCDRPCCNRATFECRESRRHTHTCWLMTNRTSTHIHFFTSCHRCFQLICRRSSARSGWCQSSSCCWR